MTLKLILKNKTNGRKIISNLLKDYDIGEPFNNSTISELLGYHPEKDTSPLEYCVMRIGEYANW